MKYVCAIQIKVNGAGEQEETIPGLPTGKIP